MGKRPKFVHIMWKICAKKLCKSDILLSVVNGGLGIPENIVTLCPECHFKEDMGQNTKLYEQKIKEYLQSKYEDWNEENLIYKKYDNWG